VSRIAGNLSTVKIFGVSLEWPMLRVHDCITFYEGGLPPSYRPHLHVLLQQPTKRTCSDAATNSRAISDEFAFKPILTTHFSDVERLPEYDIVNRFEHNSLSQPPYIDPRKDATNQRKFVGTMTDAIERLPKERRKMEPEGKELTSGSSYSTVYST
jgi:hypothetical protein